MSKTYSRMSLTSRRVPRSLKGLSGGHMAIKKQIIDR